MRKQRLLVSLLLFPALLGPAGSAQVQQSVIENGRKIVTRTAPAYPEVARKMNLAGTVKVIAVVAANGNVKSVEPVGGSPVLLKAAEDAVSRWKFAPGGESRENVEIHFNP